MDYRFSKSEYNSLRNELIARLGYIYNLAHNAAITVFAAWTLGITMLIFIMGKREEIIFNIDMLYVIDSIFF